MNKKSYIKYVSEMGTADADDQELDNEDEQLIDDGLFGFGEPLSKAAALEATGVQDPENGAEILVSTTARITFRKAFPQWGKLRNSILNKAIANSFASGNIVQYFKPKKGDSNDVGEVRSSGGARYIAVIASSGVKIIAVKGTPPSLNIPTAPVPAKEELKEISNILI